MLDPKVLLKRGNYVILKMGLWDIIMEKIFFGDLFPETGIGEPELELYLDDEKVERPIFDGD